MQFIQDLFLTLALTPIIEKLLIRHQEVRRLRTIALLILNKLSVSMSFFFSIFFLDRTMTERCMCSFKTESGFALLYWHRLTYFPSLSSARSSRRKCMTPTNCCAVCWRITSQAFCLLSLAVHRETWGNAAVEIGEMKQLTERRQAEFWGAFFFACFPFK